MKSNFYDFNMASKQNFTLYIYMQVNALGLCMIKRNSSSSGVLMMDMFSYEHYTGILKKIIW